jgi:hypothetical protein
MKLTVKGIPVTIKHENRLFAEGVPFQVMQNLVTALDPDLLTEHTVMLLFHDLSHSFPVEELPHRLLDLIAEYFNDDESDTAEATH